MYFFIKIFCTLFIHNNIFLFKKCETGILKFPDSHNVNPENVNTENMNPENMNPELCESGQYLKN